MDSKTKASAPTTKSVQPEQKSGSAEAITQREAVYQEVMKILRQEKVALAPKQAVKAVLKESHMKTLVTAIMTGFKAGAIALKDTDSNKKKLTDAKLLEIYVIGLVNNWLRRDGRLNGAGDKVQS